MSTGSRTTSSGSSADAADPVLPLDAFPALNATLNGMSAGLLAAGYGFIRMKRVAAHRACMLGATLVSALFLVSYLYYHAHAGVTRFQGTGWVRTAYFVILISHTLLAAVVPVLAAIVLTLALRGRFDRHRRIARWALPIWAYVSVTGIVVYWMLYRL
jgi:putative membrane protein